MNRTEVHESVVDGVRYRMNIQWGVKTIEATQFKIAERPTPTRWWQRSRVEYWIETEFVSFGPFDTRAEVVQMQRLANFT